MKFAFLFKTMGVIAAVFAASWLLLIVIWRSTGADPGNAAMAGWLLGMPLLILGGIGVALLLRNRRAAGASMAETGTEEALPDTPATAPFRIHAAALRTPLGNDPGEVLAALGKPATPGLHPRLRDGRGLPATAAEVADLDTAPIAAALAAQSLPALPETHLRALSLMDGLLEDLATLGCPPATDTTAEGPGEPPGPSPHPTVLVPPDWTPAECRTAACWLARRLRQAGWPEAVDVLPATPSELMEKLFAPSPEGSQPRLWLAAGSHLSAEQVRRWDAAGQLFSARRPQGRIPGETAVAVLLGPAAPDTEAGRVDAPLADVHAPVLRDVPASGRRRAGPNVELLQALFEASGIAPERVSRVFSDAGRDPERAGELAGAVNLTLPDLDPIQDVVALAAAIGEAGPAATLAALALAAHQARADGQPVPLLSLAQPRRHAAVLLIPSPAGAAAAAA